MTNSSWIDFNEQKPPDGSSAIAYIKDEYFECRLAIYKSCKISSGYTVFIDGLIHFDFNGEILCWKPAEEIMSDIPIKYN